VAFELLQVHTQPVLLFRIEPPCPLQIRTGPQLGPSLRGGPKITGTVEDAAEEFRATFEAARGAKGATLCANAIKLAGALRESAAGEASEEIIRLTKL
jgi:hypothetical protein